MLACFNEVNFEIVGFTCALLSTIVFVAQNIFAKNLFNASEVTTANRPAPSLDKLNLLFYSNLLAFTFMFPIWLSSEGYGSEPQEMTPYLATMFLINGTSQFSQNFIAFQILYIVSPVTYSVASLFKRVFIIVASILWFHDAVSLTQGCGVILTFWGLWLYQQAKIEAKAASYKLGHPIHFGSSSDLPSYQGNVSSEPLSDKTSKFIGKAILHAEERHPLSMVHTAPQVNGYANP